MNGFMAMVEASQKGKERSVNVDEAHREEAYPDICSEECTFITCGFRRQENYGKICEKKWEQYKTKEKGLPNPLARIPNTQRQVDEIVNRLMKPFLERLEKLETGTPIERHIQFNGKKMHLSGTLNTQGFLRVDRDRNKN